MVQRQVALHLAHLKIIMILLETLYRACQGNRACWDGEFTFERCCIDADAAIPAELTAVGVPWQPLQMLEAISDGAFLWTLQQG